MSMDSGRASLLVASPLLQDTNFEQAVVLLIEQNGQGAFGFVINRPSPISLKEVVFLNTEQQVPSNLKVWWSGVAQLWVNIGEI